MAGKQRKPTIKEQALAAKMLRVRFPNPCKPMKCKITINYPCAALVTCDPMTCGGFECGGLKKA